jgi:hypothetical protein
MVARNRIENVRRRTGICLNCNVAAGRYLIDSSARTVKRRIFAYDARSILLEMESGVPDPTSIRLDPESAAQPDVTPLRRPDDRGVRLRGNRPRCGTLFRACCLRASTRTVRRSAPIVDKKRDLVHSHVADRVLTGRDSHVDEDEIDAGTKRRLIEELIFTNVTG